MADGVSEAAIPVLDNSGVARPDTLTVPVAVGRRALVVANLGLTAEAGAATTWASSGLARALDTWDGPGLVVIAGNLLDLSGEPDPASAAAAALAAHPRLARALEVFAGGDDRRIIAIPGTTDATLGAEAAPVLAHLGVQPAAAADLHMATAAGNRVGARRRRKYRARRRRRWRPRAGAATPGAAHSPSPPTPRPSGRTAWSGWRTRPARLAS